jgi:hypothetical protein
MALTVEDGTGLTDADSLVSTADVQAYAASLGQVLPVDVPTVEAMIRMANLYLLKYEPRFKGRRTNPQQSLPFPRDGLIVFFQPPPSLSMLSIPPGMFGLMDWPTNVMPSQALLAIKQLVVESLTQPLMPNFDGLIETETRVGVVQSQFTIRSSQPVFPAVEAIILPLLTSPSVLSTLRV